MTDNEVINLPFENGFVSTDGKQPSSKEPERDRPGPALPWTASMPRIEGDRLQSARQAWENAGKHLTDPAAKAEHMARFNEAVRMDQPDYLPPNEAEAKLLKEHGLASDPRDIRFQHELAQKHGGEIGGMLAGAKFQPGLAGTLGDHLAANGVRLQAMTANERTNWLAGQETQLEKLAGGKKAAEQVAKDAEEMLGRLRTLPDIAGGKLARDLKGTHLARSAFFQLSMANQLALHKSYEAAIARRAKAGKK